MARIVHTRPYADARRAEYPKLAEFVDAYYWERRGDPKPMQIWLAKVDAVKAKYSKHPKEPT